MNIKQLKLKANSIRVDIIEMLAKAGSGHPAGALGMADIVSVLYFNELKHNPKKANWDKRDFFILSNGHTNPVLYAALAESNYFKKKEFLTLRQLNSRLQGHPHYGALPGVENSGGPLGQGISQAVGLAASLKRDKKLNRVYCFVGDGELEEGQCWEAFLFAQKEKLNNLVTIVDYNHIQIDGDPNEVIHLGSLNKKFRAFDFTVIEFDGNSIPQILKAFSEARKIKGKPVCLLAKTIPGKGVSFMEKDFHWHGKIPNEEQQNQALAELKLERGKIENE